MKQLVRVYGHGKLEGARLRSYVAVAAFDLLQPLRSPVVRPQERPSLFLPSTVASRNPPQSRSMEPTSATYCNFHGFTFMPLTYCSSSTTPIIMRAPA